MAAGDDGVTTTVTAEVHVSHHQFLLLDGATSAEMMVDFANGLFYGKPGALAVVTGIHTGLVEVTVEIRSSPPAEVDLVWWEEVAETDLQADEGRVEVASLLTEWPDLPRISPYGPGHYGVRVHAHGRDIDPDGVASVPFETYLIQIWPTRVPLPERVYKQTDAFGRRLRP